MATARLILASSSPVRAQLLRGIGLCPHITPPDIDESIVKGEKPSAYVCRMAREKAQKVASQFSEDFVLAADTIISMGTRIFVKAPDEDQARVHMQTLSGRRHRCSTALCLITPRGTVERLCTTVVLFKRLSALEIEAFIISRDWENVCVYRQERIAGTFIKQMNGAALTVAGMPLHAAAQMLIGCGFPVFGKQVL